MNRKIIPLKLSFYFFLLLAGFSCSRNPMQETDFITAYRNSQKEHKNFCVLFGGGENCNPCNQMVEVLKDHKITSDFSDKYNFYKCDVTRPENEFLLHIFLMEAIPNLYIFNADGKLISHHFHRMKAERIKQILSDAYDYTRIHYEVNHQFHSSPDQVISMHNYLLQAAVKYKIQPRNPTSLQEILKDIDNSIKIEPYFYNLYFKSIVQQELQQTDSARNTAVLALHSLKNNFQGIVYDSLIRELKNNVLQLSNAKENPTVEFETKEIDCGDIDAKHPYRFTYKLKNNGEKPLHILTVHSSCGCITPKWETQPILPQKNSEIEVTFESSEKGYFSRTIVVQTTGTPSLETLRLTGFVK